jgi:hypothetical protein
MTLQWYFPTCWQTDPSEDGNLARARSGQVGFMVNNVALEQVFFENYGFPCQSLFHQILHPHNHSGQVQYARRGLRAE